ncbi:palmitoyltransferase ZDHHC12 isoform X2 [Bombina bombina]|uniref:palmitoyltransferase ZDHHC12 isoform X2 n=1 Tax=Bombina bombina TaxID=8345 RepID=UPI00235A5211|nr:palmitoyltransferase ZDHHC12 isoform X2 [Bombina bombina]
MKSIKLDTQNTERAEHLIADSPVSSSDLHHQDKRWQLLHPLAFVLLVLGSVFLYFAVSLMDPGFVLSDLKDLESAELIQGSPLRMRRCGYCLLQQPMRARHCKTCQHCVRRFDHHCPWIENCVGERNHPLFILYLVVQFMALLWAFQLAWSGFRSEAAWTDWLYTNLLLLLASVLTGTLTVVVSLLLVCHLYLISCNVTTWEFMSQHRISYLKHHDSDTSPFDEGVLCNLWRFFCTFGSVAWERVYFRNAHHVV